MRITIADVQVPFCMGGAELLADRLKKKLYEYGHQAEIVTLPFCFSPPEAVSQSIELWQGNYVGRTFEFYSDALIALRFPAYLCSHPNRALWLLHQHRAIYDLWDTKYTYELSQSSKGQKLKAKIESIDSRILGQYKKRFTISATVSERLQKFNGLTSKPLYHPPPLFGNYYCQPEQPYIFCPSRLEDLKRQDLLIDAIAQLPYTVFVVLAGEGGNHSRLEAKIEKLGLKDRVYLLGRVSQSELLAFYANCRAVFFAPYEEDLGYVTFEAMLSQKPVITCLDSGEPSRIILNNQTGFICEPCPSSIATAINTLWKHPNQAREMGVSNWEHYQSFSISWENVVTNLISALS
ncbi:glycosyltransferase family 4 protein [Synechococcus elongatus]|uniref:Glycosyltransferase family 4 protein n=1 Tax=Synechococcus elongatus PCC 11802 TaxID=2283154 RepID=A0AAT9JUS4_SYNEL|nr:glycosyltransferase family 4 protein [Synechococcus elongatus]QFZ92886.1 glycosyltransferase [Synechococcus elongatus PCC 11802]